MAEVTLYKPDATVRYPNATDAIVQNGVLFIFLAEGFHPPLRAEDPDQCAFSGGGGSGKLDTLTNHDIRDTHRVGARPHIVSANDVRALQDERGLSCNCSQQPLLQRRIVPFPRQRPSNK